LTYAYVSFSLRVLIANVSVSADLR